MKTAAKAMERSPMKTRSSRAKAPSPATLTRRVTRIRARKAQLVMPPPRSAPTRPGGPPDASGVEVWSGPCRDWHGDLGGRRGKRAGSRAGGSPPRAGGRGRKMVGQAHRPRYAACERKKEPRRGAASPAEPMTRYFHVASSDRAFRLK